MSISSKLKVAIVAPSLRILGGQAVQADRLLRAWKNDPDVDAWLVPINPLPPSPLHFLTRAKYVRTLCTQLTFLPQLVRQTARADLIHVFSASYFSFMLAPVPAYLAARVLGRPILLNYHSGEAPDHLERSRVARTIVKAVDHNVVPSPFLADVFRRHGVEAQVVANLIDTDEFAYRERAVLRPRILSTRNLDYPYNIACTLRAFRLIQDHRPDATLTVVGSGKHEQALRALAADLRSNHVTFVGRVDPSAINRVYDDHDIYLQSPDIDNMPLSLLEAFASGLPVVSTDAGGIPTMLRHGEDGLLAPLNDHATLAAHVLRLLDEPHLGSILARNARARIDAYRWPVVRTQWLRAYRQAYQANGSMRAARRSAVPPTPPTVADSTTDARQEARLR